MLHGKMPKRVLVVEDDPAISRLLHDNLAFEGFTVECAGDGQRALERVGTFFPDLVLLDLMLPGQSGFEVCQAMSTRANRPGIIVLTSKRAESDKVRALNLGADDYVTKPFALDELLARINAVLRRSHPEVDSIVLGSIVVDFRNSRAYKGSAEVDLRPREIEILRHLAARQGKVVTREELLRLVWGYEQVPLTRTVDIAIARLRRKIEPDPHHPRFLRTAHRDGYTLTLNP
jgi:two-component system, OmpR family, response regulator VicR